MLNRFAVLTLLAASFVGAQTLKTITATNSPEQIDALQDAQTSQEAAQKKADELKVLLAERRECFKGLAQAFKNGDSELLDREIFHLFVGGSKIRDAAEFLRQYRNDLHRDLEKAHDKKAFPHDQYLMWWETGAAELNEFKQPFSEEWRTLLTEARKQIPETYERHEKGFWGPIEPKPRP